MKDMAGSLMGCCPLAIIALLLINEVYGFVNPQQIVTRSSSSVLFAQQQQQPERSRRDIIVNTIASSVVLSPLFPVNALAEDEDKSNMMSNMFNEDGSLKEGVESEVKERLVEFTWDGSVDQLQLNTDAKNAPGTKDESPNIKLSYKYNYKWSDGKDGDEIYFDRTEGTNAKACKRITVYQAPGKGVVKQLEKASLVGVAKSLKAPENELSRLYKADIISGRVSKRNDQTYYEFDMAAAPETCGNSAENLGLGKYIIPPGLCLDPAQESRKSLPHKYLYGEISLVSSGCIPG